MERSLVLVKPDAVQRALAGQVISRLENKGLKIVAMKMLHMDTNLAEQHYAIHKGKPFFDELVSFISSSPLIAVVFQGENAVQIIRQMMAQSRQIVVAADSSKIGKTSLEVVGDVQNVDILVTDATFPNNTLEAIRDAGVEVMHA